MIRSEFNEMRQLAAGGIDGESNKEKHRQELLDFVKRGYQAAKDSREIRFMTRNKSARQVRRNQLEGFENLFLARRCG